MVCILLFNELYQWWDIYYICFLTYYIKASSHFKKVNALLFQCQDPVLNVGIASSNAQLASKNKVQLITVCFRLQLVSLLLHDSLIQLCHTQIVHCSHRTFGRNTSYDLLQTAEHRLPIPMVHEYIWIEIYIA